TILFATTFFAGIFKIQILTAVPSFIILVFVVYILKKHYSLRATNRFITLYMTAGAVFALIAYLLTN
ncbi:MAG: hypothetical protein M3Q14_02045, partial [bacterium]|nr:hypothetical protein [bacterium]